MTRAFWAGAISRTRHLAWLWTLVGMFVAWAAINIGAEPGIVITQQSEAEGPQFSDANTLDLVTEVRRNRPCPSQTQRWVWRWTEYHGHRAQQIIPLVGTDMPFLAESGTLILTLPTSQVPDPVNGGWMYRAVTSERCGFLPEYVGRWFGGRMFRSPDLPVSFVGAPHGGVPPVTP